MKQEEWFRDWFNTPYYGLLYRHRNDEEARAFIDRLLGILHLPAGAHVLDLCCGSGRHSRFLHSRGLDVTGIDLSEHSIAQAARCADEGLHFQVADMRSFHLDRSFDAIFNLFTSFGYFDDPHDNFHVLERVAEHLVSGGYFVLDYLHAGHVRSTLVPEEERTIDGVHFRLRKYVEDNAVVKEIHVVDGDATMDFEERVRLFEPQDLEDMIRRAGLEIGHRFGNYLLGGVSEKGADRCIFVARKP